MFSVRTVYVLSSLQVTARTGSNSFSIGRLRVQGNARAIMPINAFRFGHMPNSVEKKTPNNLENYRQSGNFFSQFFTLNVSFSAETARFQ